jgi:hypothetical protein
VSTTRGWNAITLLLDALLENRLANHVLDDGAPQFATHVFAELGSILLLDSDSGAIGARDRTPVARDSRH